MRIILTANIKDDVLTVPLNTLYRDSEGYYVYKAEGGQRVKTAVAVGVKNETMAEIIGGLSEGDEIYVKN